MFNVYGEGNDKGVIRKFLIKIKNDMPLTVHGDGEYVRDYIYVEDVVSTIKDFVEKNHKSGVYEVGTGIGTSVNELIGTIEKITDKKLEIINEPCPYDIIKDSVSKKSVVKNTIKLEVGLTKVWNSIMKGEND
jgi:nucleoside-diphosphate-sugar epimerase